MLKDYFGQADYIEGIGNIYPIKLLDYEEFSKLAQKYIAIDKRYLEIELGEEIKVSSLALILGQIKAFEIANDDNYLSLVNSEEIEYYKQLRNSNNKLSIESFEKVLEMILKKKVTYDEENIKFIIKSENILDENEINEDNFDKFKNVVMRQNLLFTPLYYEDITLQSILESLREDNQKSNSSRFDLETICQVVSNEKKIPQYELKDFTYYQVIADYTRLGVIDNHDVGKQVQASGFADKDFKMPKRDEFINLNEHPEARLIEFNSEVYDKGDKL